VILGIKKSQNNSDIRYQEELGFRLHIPNKSLLKLCFSTIKKSITKLNKFGMKT